VIVGVTSPLKYSPVVIFVIIGFVSSKITCEVSVVPVTVTPVLV
jgi:hypothetical protein